MRSVQGKHYETVLKFWRSFEIFNFPEASKPEGEDRYEVTDLQPDGKFPWHQEVFGSPSPGKRWLHTLYICPVPKQEVIDLVNIHLKGAASDFQEPLDGVTCLSALIVDHNGYPTDKSYVRAAFVYGLKMVIDNEPLEKIDEYLKNIQKDYQARFENNLTQKSIDFLDEIDVNSNKTPVGWTELKKEHDDLKKIVPSLTKLPFAIKCLSEEVNEKREPGAAFFNGFYTIDLNLLIAKAKDSDLGKSLTTYLTGSINVEGRIDLLDRLQLLQHLDPTHLPQGRWPSNPKYGLYTAQQVAINNTIKHLRKEDGLLGINGPPGTGKTTLLREIVADAVVTRAKRLIKIKPNNLFSHKYNKIAEYVGYYEAKSDFFGNDGILVASNNNSAVENISAELPMSANIDLETFQDAAYFPEMAEKIHPGKDCWGLLSAVLGNAGNRFKFTNKFWYNEGFRDYLKGKSEEKDQKVLIGRFETVAEELNKLIEDYECFQKTAIEYHEALNKAIARVDVKGKEQNNNLNKLSAELSDQYGISPSDLFNESYPWLSMDQIHKSMPYSSPQINTLRSNIFLKSLELHACAINVNAKYIKANLNAFFSMLEGRNSDAIDEGLVQTLWNNFFFCIPVVSTTLASVERFLSKMGPQSIGWLLLDEAGQATPQSACGVLWRAKRAVLIGDTMQIPPVVTIPKVLGKLLLDKSGIADDDWSPMSHSAQYLADRATQLGTYIDIEDTKVWTGTPLRAHRRCNEPMFAIANKIAYNNQMVKVTPDEDNNVLPVKSCWYDVRGENFNQNIVLEEFMVLSDAIQKIRLSGFTDTIFVISPFKSVANDCGSRLRSKSKINCGTIHTFQGKEADVVFIILGSGKYKHHARLWVSETPNMLNVAITRAKKRVYIIGNKEIWSRYRYFTNLSGFLPIIPAMPGSI